MAEFRMPSLGADMEQATLVEWLVKPGDEVKRGDIVAVVETEKGAIEIEIFEHARIEEYLVDVGTVVAVGGVLARITSLDGGEETSHPIEAPTGVPETPAGTPQGPPSIQMPRPSGTQVVASPAARKIAAERNIDLTRIKGTGPGGAIVSSDVLAQAVEAPAHRGLDLKEMRKVIAAAMSRSKREIPHYYIQHTFDLEPAQAWLSQTNAERDPPERLLMGALFIKALAVALKKYPEFNGTYGQTGFEPGGGVHVGMAVAIRGGGLVAPAIHDTDGLTLNDLMDKMRDLVNRVRNGGLRSSEMSAPTITLSSLGDRGVESFFGVIYPPQVAILGFGTPVRRPWVVEDRIVPRVVVTVSLSADHRVSDGHRGALLLAHIEKLLQNPEAL